MTLTFNRNLLLNLKSPCVDLVELHEDQTHIDARMGINPIFNMTLVKTS